MTQQRTRGGQELDRALFYWVFCTQNLRFLAPASSSGPDGDLPHPDEVICVAGKQGLRRERESAQGKGRVASKVGPQDTRTRDYGPQRANPKAERDHDQPQMLGKIKEKSSKVGKGPREGRDPGKFSPLLAETAPGAEHKCLHGPCAPRGSPKSWFPRAGMAGQGEGDGFYLPVCGPGQGSALGWFGFAAGADHLLLQLVHDDFAFQVLQEKDDDDDEGTRGSCRKIPTTESNPSPERREGAEVRSETASGFPHRDAVRWH